MELIFITSHTVIELEKDTVTYTKDMVNAAKANNPIPYPDLLETIISNELVAKNVSEYTHNSIYKLLLNLKKTSNYEAVGHYHQFLEEMILNLELEIDLLNGEIEVNDLEVKFNSKKSEIEKKINENILEIKTQ